MPCRTRPAPPDSLDGPHPPLAFIDRVHHAATELQTERRRLSGQIAASDADADADAPSVSSFAEDVVPCDGESRILSAENHAPANRISSFASRLDTRPPSFLSAEPWVRKASRQTSIETS